MIDPSIYGDIPDDTPAQSGSTDENTAEPNTASAAAETVAANDNAPAEPEAAATVTESRQPRSTNLARIRPRTIGMAIAGFALLFGIATGRFGSLWATSHSAKLADDAELAAEAFPTPDRVLDAARRWHAQHATFEGYPLPDGYLAAVGYDTIVVSATIDGQCLMGAIVALGAPVTDVDETGQACTQAEIAAAQAAIDAAEGR